jgi:hypothetical protein
MIEAAVQYLLRATGTSEEKNKSIMYWLKEAGFTEREAE